MNSSSFDQILRQVLIVPLLAVLLGASIIYWDMHGAARTVTQMQKADEAIASTVLTERLIIDQETGLRGYQTTANPLFLEPYREATRELPAQFDRLRASAANDPHQQATIADLQAEYDAWEQGFAAPLITSIQAGAHTSDLDLNLLGKRQMDSIRSRTAALTASAQQTRDLQVHQWRSEVRNLTYALILIAILIGLVIGLYTRRLLQDVSGAFRQSHNVLRIRAEQTFRSEQKLRTTLQSIGDGVITCDAEGAIQTMNDVAQQLTGWSEAEARNRPLEDVFNIINETTRQPLETPVAKVKRLNAVVTLANHTILIRKDHSELFIEDSGAPVRDKFGKLTGVVLVFRDVTLARKSQDALLANEKLAVAGRLAATIAHEIHNPLDSVSNLLFLMDGNCSPEEHDQFLQLAKGEIARVTQISRAMLSLYRESRAPVPIDLNEMLTSILLLMERRFANLNVSVTPSIPEGLTIHGFPAELRQVFTNLLTNAAEAAGSGGNITLNAQSCMPHTTPAGTLRELGVCITVADHGPGIPDEVQRNLFTPFFTTKGEGGTGLGLWVSRGIVNKHGGEITLTSSTDPATHGTAVAVFLATNPTIHPAGD